MVATGQRAALTRVIRPHIAAACQGASLSAGAPWVNRRAPCGPRPSTSSPVTPAPLCRKLDPPEAQQRDGEEPGWPARSPAPGAVSQELPGRRAGGDCLRRRHKTHGDAPGAAACVPGNPTREGRNTRPSGWGRKSTVFDVPKVDRVRMPIPGQGELPAAWRRGDDFRGVDFPWRRIR